MSGRGGGRGGGGFRGGRGGGARGSLANVAWANDPTLKADMRPSEVFPVRCDRLVFSLSTTHLARLPIVLLRLYRRLLTYSIMQFRNMSSQQPRL